MKFSFCGVEFVECHLEQIDGEQLRVFKAEMATFDGQPSITYLAIPADYVGADPASEVAFLKSVHASRSMLWTPWEVMPRSIADGATAHAA